jgi:hypothetical protein
MEKRKILHCREIEPGRASPYPLDFFLCLEM